MPVGSSGNVVTDRQTAAALTDDMYTPEPCAAHHAFKPHRWGEGMNSSQHLLVPSFPLVPCVIASANDSDEMRQFIG